MRREFAQRDTISVRMASARSPASVPCGSRELDRQQYALLAGAQPLGIAICVAIHKLFQVRPVPARTAVAISAQVTCSSTTRFRSRSMAGKGGNRSYCGTRLAILSSTANFNSATVVRPRKSKRRNPSPLTSPRKPSRWPSTSNTPERASSSSRCWAGHDRQNCLPIQSRYDRLNDPLEHAAKSPPLVMASIRSSSGRPAGARQIDLAHLEQLDRRRWPAISFVRRRPQQAGNQAAAQGRPPQHRHRLTSGAASVQGLKAADSGLARRR